MKAGTALNATATVSQNGRIKQNSQTSLLGSEIGGGHCPKRYSNSFAKWENKSKTPKHRCLGVKLEAGTALKAIATVSQNGRIKQNSQTSLLGSENGSGHCPQYGPSGTRTRDQPVMSREL